jgi:hypothetical protein
MDPVMDVPGFRIDLLSKLLEIATWPSEVPAE